MESNQNIYQEYKQYRDPELKYWDETYDSMQPNKLINYENSQEFLMELDDWKDYLLHLNENSVLEFVEAEDKDMREKEIEEKDDKDEEYEDEDEDENEIIFEEYPDFAGKSKSMVPDNDRTSIKKTNNMGQRLLQKYGWKPGTGLGRESSGITKPLKFSMSRRRPGMGRIVDKNEKKRSKFGDSSRVIKIIGMISSDGESQNLDMPSKLSKTFEKVFWVVSKIYIYLYSFCLILISLARF